MIDLDQFKIKPYQVLLFIGISAGLLFITESWPMALGILLLLIIGNRMLAEYIYKKRGNKDDNHL